MHGAVVAKHAIRLIHNRWIKSTAWITAITEQWDRRLQKLQDYLLSQCH